MQSLHALMRDIGDLRRRLEADLTLAAAALEQGELAVADDLLEDGVCHVQAFEQRSLQHLDRPASAPRAPRSVRRMLVRPALTRRPSLVGHLPRRPRLRELAGAAAAAVLAVVALASPASQGGVVLQASAPPPDVITQVSDPGGDLVAMDLAASYDALTTLASMPEPPPVADVRAVADELAEKVTMLRSTPQRDPINSIAALRVLEAERRVITASDPDRSALVDLMERNQRLTADLLDAIAGLVQPVVPVPLAPGAAPAPTAPAAPAGPTTRSGLLSGLTGGLIGPLTGGR